MLYNEHLRIMDPVWILLYLGLHSRYKLSWIIFSDISFSLFLKWLVS